MENSSDMRVADNGRRSSKALGSQEKEATPALERHPSGSKVSHSPPPPPPPRPHEVLHDNDKKGNHRVRRRSSILKLLTFHTKGKRKLPSTDDVREADLDVENKEKKTQTPTKPLSAVSRLTNRNHDNSVSKGKQQRDPTQARRTRRNILSRIGFILGESQTPNCKDDSMEIVLDTANENKIPTTTTTATTKVPENHIKAVSQSGTNTRQKGDALDCVECESSATDVEGFSNSPQQSLDHVGISHHHHHPPTTVGPFAKVRQKARKIARRRSSFFRKSEIKRSLLDSSSDFWDSAVGDDGWDSKTTTNLSRQNSQAGKNNNNTNNTRTTDHPLNSMGTSQTITKMKKKKKNNNNNNNNNSNDSDTDEEEAIAKPSSQLIFELLGDDSSSRTKTLPNITVSEIPVGSDGACSDHEKLKNRADETPIRRILPQLSAELGKVNSHPVRADDNDDDDDDDDEEEKLNNNKSAGVNQVTNDKRGTYSQPSDGRIVVNKQLPHKSANKKHKRRSQSNLDISNDPPPDERKHSDALKIENVVTLPPLPPKPAKKILNETEGATGIPKEAKQRERHHVRSNGRRKRHSTLQPTETSPSQPHENKSSEVDNGRLAVKSSQPLSISPNDRTDKNKKTQHSKKRSKSKSPSRKSHRQKDRSEKRDRTKSANDPKNQRERQPKRQSPKTSSRSPPKPKDAKGPSMSPFAHSSSRYLSRDPRRSRSPPSRRRSPHSSKSPSRSPHSSPGNGSRNSLTRRTRMRSKSPSVSPYSRSSGSRTTHSKSPSPYSPKPTIASSTSPRTSRHSPHSKASPASRNSTDRKTQRRSLSVEDLAPMPLHQESSPAIRYTKTPSKPSRQRPEQINIGLSTLSPIASFTPSPLVNRNPKSHSPRHIRSLLGKGELNLVEAKPGENTNKHKHNRKENKRSRDNKLLSPKSATSPTPKKYHSSGRQTSSRNIKPRSRSQVVGRNDSAKQKV